ncbi:MAG: hypothetical protein V3U43_10160 [Pseudomonadales bacterium]
MKARTKIMTIAMVLLAAGCTSSATVLERPFPAPVLDPIPLTIGVYYSDDFRAYVYAERIPRKGTIEIKAGAANVRLFDRVLPGMFTGVVHLLGPLDTGEGVDAIFIPTLEDFQIALPHQTHNDFSEVWIKYQLKLMAPDGEAIASWKLVAYGKSPKGMLESEKGALWVAARVALRDAGAFFAIKFKEVAGVRQWLLENGALSMQAPVGEAEAAHET